MKIIGTKYELQRIHDALCQSNYDILGCEPMCRRDGLCDCQSCIEESIEWYYTDNAGIYKNKYGQWVERGPEKYSWGHYNE